MAAIFTALFWCALQVSLFLLLAAPVYLLVRRRNPSAGTAVAASALAAVVALSALAISPWPRWSLEWPTSTSANVERAAAVQGGGEAEANAAATGDESPTPTASAAAGGDDSLLAAFWRVAQYNGEAVVPSVAGAAIADNRIAWPSWIVWAIAAGVLLGAVHLLVSLAAVRRLIGRSMPLDDPATRQELDDLRRQLDVTRPISLHVSAEISTPATVGMFRPAIILPTTWTMWTNLERRAVLAHELAHIAGRDFAAWLVARGAVVLHFYHPLVRWFVGRLQLDQELAADDTAARLLGDRKAYLQALASLALATPHERLAGSLRTFIPTRSLLVRRVEMLRTNESLLASNRTRSKWRWAMLPLVGALALLAAGLRPSAPVNAVAAEQNAGGGLGAPGAAPSLASTDSGAEQDAKATSPQAAADGFDFSYVPDGASFVVAVRPVVMASSPRLQSLAALMESSMSPQIPFSSLSQITFVMPRPMSHTVQELAPGTSYEYTLLRTKEPFDFKKALSTSYGVITEEEHHGRRVLTQNSGGSITFYSPDERRLISYSETGLRGVIDNPQADAAPKDAEKWSSALTGPIFATADPKAIRSMIAPGSIINQLFRPVIDAAEQVTLATEDGEEFIITLRIVCREGDGVIKAMKTLESARILAKNVVDGIATTEDPATPGADPAVSRVALAQLAKGVLDTVEMRTDDLSVVITAKVPNARAVVADVLMPQLELARHAASRAQSQNNLKQLALAALNYADVNNGYPPAVVYGKSAFPDLNASGNKKAHVPRSWRVELLPLLGMEELYKQYRLDQPWDSEANLKVLQQMPAVYRSPFDLPQSTNASFFAVTGPGTVFDGEEHTPLTAISDGTSNTLLWVEAKQEIPWTKPEDIAYEPEKVLFIQGWTPGIQFIGAMCDGSVRQFDGLSHEELKDLVGKADWNPGAPPPPTEPLESR